MFDLTGRSALVTGSSRGIGYALAQGLLEAGARVVIHGRDVEQAAASAARLREITGGEVRVAPSTSPTPRPSTRRRRIEERWGTPDILVNNAGIQRRAPFTEFAAPDWNDLVATNLTSAFLVGQRVARGMVTRGSGKIINIGSVQSQLARPEHRSVQRHQGWHRDADPGACAPTSVRTASRPTRSRRATSPPS